MKKQAQDGFFWPSFTDLMTSLFFIMLVLYVLTFIKMKIQQEVTEQQLNKIKQITAAVKALDTNYFRYDPVFKRYQLTRNIHYSSQAAVISPVDTTYLVNAGMSISKLLVHLHQLTGTEDTRYIVIVEGMSSKDQYIKNFQLSYDRAQSIRVLWIRHHIKFDPAICELQISGSGIGGVGRDPDENKNQRILIQILPKIGDVAKL
ncbi:OmpA family protein [Mucilaginibacter corticis]|uniref:OmpA family protein n=1 Tax=Mucilaginibacter corticis TaxID=2597670 RepID=A0A556M9I1_9SPHI|nr:OmpA family protein [Mucilaginibacter corticis]TSJ36552.1 OmpA family protein [Mucilaginibacter corticis]